MNVTCHNCKTKLNIPDHKIPKDKEASFKCPKCKETVLVPALAQQKPAGEIKRQPNPISFEERQNALVCIEDSELKKKVYAIIQQMGFNAEAVTDTKAALNKMEYHIYHLVIIDEAFEPTMGISGIIDRMNTIDMSLRRRICLVLVSSKYNSNDNMVALHSSVNAIIHRDDIPHLEPFLSKVLIEHKNFYTVYSESLRLAGKA
ncbi:MAG: zinc-ribbon domain-containing protein [Proteobacteria bacterium]|nr:zinc-ribbon domain-containing protein [Pseudomonadota bacterium]MBU1581630.1 zinc-ribbon domain-containing protein [Pseudomonadota bacterium]MBU2456091.1 zinc-ribbon domain-containing protein [Pseudomonadota bacterium]MBU2630108.1 zinc-ribbon domain-containing protein [Pseudomonadota bacterium]